MNQQLATTQTFQERLKERIRDSIGELITDEDLQGMIERGVEEVFFKPRYRKVKRNFSTIEEEMPPLIHEMVTELLTEQMNAAIREWLVEHAEEVNQVFATVAREGAGDAVLVGLTRALQPDFQALQHAVEQRLDTGQWPNRY